MNVSSAAKAYSKVGIETAVGSADPLGLVVMLYDGAILAVNKAVAGLRDQNMRLKGESVSKAIQIIEEGLRASLDRKAGGNIALQLDSLYEYMCQRLLLASVANDAAPMNEVARLLADLRESWWSLASRPAGGTQAAAQRVVARA
jgi:flagellar protein FliS